jgi:hypothetical protein
MILRLVIIQYKRRSLKPDLNVELLAVLMLVYEEPAQGHYSVLLLPRGEKAALHLKLEPAPHSLLVFMVSLFKMKMIRKHVICAHHYVFRYVFFLVRENILSLDPRALIVLNYLPLRVIESRGLKRGSFFV